MLANTGVLLTSEDNFRDDAFWEALYPVILARVRYLVQDANIPGWERQQQDIVADLVQTVMLKIFEELQQGKQFIRSVKAFGMVIAERCFIDLLRREKRRPILSYDDTDSERQQQVLQSLLVEPTQEVEDKIYEEEVLAASAQTIATFSRKLRQAILVDLANRSSFDEEPSALQQAFLAAGIRLQDYQHAPSPDAVERGRQSALRSLAYKRVSEADVVEREVSGKPF